MRSKSVFAFSTYKAVMKHFLTGEGNRGRLSAAAEALGCQRPFLSRVILEELHLTPDHAFNLSRFLQLDADEREYFMSLVEVERAASLEYRNHHKQKLADLRRKHDSLHERTGRQSLTIDSDQTNYFASWTSTAVHMLTAVPEYQTAGAISARLGLKEKTTLRQLEQLEKLGFVEHARGKWQYKTGESHAKKDSPLVLMHHQNWRSRAVLDAHDFDEDGVHYTAVQTVSREDVAKLRTLMIDFIADSSRIAGPSNPEDAVVILCDFFRL